MSDINPFAQQHTDIRQGVRAVCQTFNGAYWQHLEESSGYPEAFVQALTQAGWLAALIPEEFGGAGIGLVEASAILEEINHTGANSGACHAQMYTMGALLRHGSP
jgi:acyl-CoA dehydrogenase